MTTVSPMMAPRAEELLAGFFTLRGIVAAPVLAAPLRTVKSELERAVGSAASLEPMESVRAAAPSTVENGRSISSAISRPVGGGAETFGAATTASNWLGTTLLSAGTLTLALQLLQMMISPTCAGGA